MSRGNFTLPAGHSWKYWKVLHSQTVSSPVYPDNGYIKYDGNINFGSYTHTKVPAGTNYYRVCAITQASDGKHRYCSRVVTINVDGNSYVAPQKEDKPAPTTYNKPTTSTSKLSSKMTEKIDRVVDKFVTRLEDRFADNPERKETVLESIVSKIKAKRAKKESPVLAYLQEKIEEELEMSSIESLLDFE